MHFGKPLLSYALILAVTVPCFASTHKHAKTAAAKPAGQRSIDDARATQIQTSLIRSGYLSGEASGHWDAQTEAAMQKFQSDNGWQTKLVPDSRAIIKLGLGPTQTSSAEFTGSPAPLPSTTASAGDNLMQQ
jgi:peptidoglycan hydrolase-like protein with peptidoglycan-binding domain